MCGTCNQFDHPFCLKQIKDSIISDPFWGIFLVGPRPRTHMVGETWWPDGFEKIQEASVVQASLPIPSNTNNESMVWIYSTVSIASGCTYLFHLQTQAINVAMPQDIMDSTHRMSQAKLRKGQTSLSLPSCSSGTCKITNVFCNLMWWCWQQWKVDSNYRKRVLLTARCNLFLMTLS